MGNTTLQNGRVYSPILDYDTISQDERNVTALKEKLIIGSFIRSYTEQMNKIEQTLWQMMTERSLKTASGANLDIIGGVVGVKRIPQSLSDEEYLTRIMTEINVRRSDSTPNTVLRIMKIVHNTAKAGSIFEHITPKVGGVCVKVVSQNYVDDAPILMKRVCPAAIGSVVILRDETDYSNCFTPAEVGGGVDYIVTNNSDSIVTDSALALVALQGGGIVQDDGKGSSLLSEDLVAAFQLSVNTQATSHTFDDMAVTSGIPNKNYNLHVHVRGIDNTVGILAEVQQLRYNSNTVEG